MSTPGLPQSGWWTDEEWADVFGESVQQFRDRCRQHGIPYKAWKRNLYLVKAEDLFEHLPYTGDEYDGEATGQRGGVDM